MATVLSQLCLAQFAQRAKQCVLATAKWCRAWLVDFGMTEKWSAQVWHHSQRLSSVWLPTLPSGCNCEGLTKVTTACLGLWPTYLINLTSASVFHSSAHKPGTVTTFLELSSIFLRAQSLDTQPGLELNMKYVQKQKQLFTNSELYERRSRFC